MKKWVVQLEETKSEFSEFEVEAQTEDEAIREANRKLRPHRFAETSHIELVDVWEVDAK